MKRRFPVELETWSHLESLDEKNVAMRQITLPLRTSHTYTNKD